jgi:hypothetical protein
MFCPECGTDAAAAKFCPECGRDLGEVKSALRGDAPATEPAGKPAAKAAQQRKPPAQQRKPPAQQRKSSKPIRTNAAPAPGNKPGQLGPRKRPATGIKPWVIWAALGAAALVFVLVLAFMNSKSTAGSPPVADTSGSYPVLLQRANGLYDQATAALNNKDGASAAKYAEAAATVYAAAWKQQPGDPSMGTDWATSLYYAGDDQGAIAQIEVVLKVNPTFQPAWLNAGIFFASASQAANDAAKKADYLRQAKAAFSKTIALNPTSAEGVQAKSSLQQLP